MNAADRKVRRLVILYLEDDPMDAELVQREFNATLPGCRWHHVQTGAQYRRTIRRVAPDLILADYNLPDFDGLSALALARTRHPRTPFIFVSGALGEEVAIETLKSGATDYVLKHRLQRLMPAVQRALAEAHEREERRRLEEELSEISHREQRRIGSDLHDGLGQELTGLSLLLRSIETDAERNAPQLVAQVARSRQVLAQAIDSTRKLARGLAPVNLERGGLAAALQHLAHQFAGKDLRCEYRAAIRPGTTLSETPATHLYRIAQEAVNNAAKHAGAHTIVITLAQQGNGLSLEVSDDGKGIDKAAAGGMGLRLMQYRARIIGAELEVERRKTGGTLIRCVCPLASADKVLATA